MSNALEKKVDKILDYLAVMTRENNDQFAAIDNRFEAIDHRFEAIGKRFDAIDKRFDAIDEDLATLKGTTRRVEERQALSEQSIGVLQDADRVGQDDIRQLDIRLSRVEDQHKSNPAPH